jgi:hypothetical protein
MIPMSFGLHIIVLIYLTLLWGKKHCAHIHIHTHIHILTNHVKKYKIKEYKVENENTREYIIKIFDHKRCLWRSDN